VCAVWNVVSDVTAWCVGDSVVGAFDGACVGGTGVGAFVGTPVGDAVGAPVSHSGAVPAVPSSIATEATFPV
jgi:hypothetical protein